MQRIAYVEITAACNFRCSFCPLISMERPMLTMKRDLVLEIIEQISREDLADRISFHLMGEPTLHKDLPLFCREATNAGLRVALVTNASRLSDSLNNALLDTNLDQIAISLRSPNDEYYSEIFKSSKKLDYEAYIGQIRSLLANAYGRGPDNPTTIIVRMFTSNVTDLIREKVPHQDDLYNTDRMISMLKGWGEELCGMNSRELQRKFPERFAAKNLMPLTPRAAIQTSRIMRWWQQEADHVKTKYPAVVSYCNGYHKQFSVLADGRVSACCLDYEGRTSLGNVKDMPLKEILGGSGVTDFVNSFNRLRPPTKTCANCLGGNTLAESVARQALLSGRRVVDRIQRKT